MLPIVKRYSAKVFRAWSLPFLAVALALAGCGDSGQGQHGTLVVVTPYTPAPASGAISSTTAPQDLTRIQVTILDTSGAVLAGPANFAPGQTASIDVEGGSGRIVRVRGYDAASDMLYQGTSNPITLASDETRTVAVNLYGKLLKGSVNLTGAKKVVGLADGQTTTTASTTVATDGSFRLTLPDGTLRPYLIYGTDASSNPVGAAIVDGPGNTSLDPLSTFQATVLANPLNGQSGTISPTQTDLTNAWSGWGLTGTAQANAITQADQNVQGAVGLTTLGVSGYRVGHGIPTPVADLLTYNPMQVTWAGGIPSLVKTTGGTVATSPSTGVVTAGGAVLTLPAASVGSSVTVARVAANTEWLLWKTGSTQSPGVVGIVLPATVSGLPTATIGQTMSTLADTLTLFGDGTGLDPASGGTALTTYLTSAAERLLLQEGDATLYQQTLTDLQNTMFAVGFSPTAPLPTASGANLSTAENTAVTATLNAISTQPGTLTFAIASQPAKGAASITGNQLTYTPSANSNGSDTLTITATDANGTSAAATIAITVTPVNDPPAPTAPAISANSGQTGTTTVAPNDPDIGDTHTFAVTTQPGFGSATVNNSGVVTYTAPASSKGTTTLTVTVTDGAGASGSVVIAVNVSDTTPPVVTPPGSISVAAINASGTISTSRTSPKNLARFLQGPFARALHRPCQ